MRPTKTQISLRIPRSRSRVFVLHMKKLCILGNPKIDATSEDSDQTARMRSLIWIFAGRTYPTVRFLPFRLQCYYFFCLLFAFAMNSITNISQICDLVRWDRHKDKEPASWEKQTKIALPIDAYAIMMTNTCMIVVEVTVVVLYLKICPSLSLSLSIFVSLSLSLFLSLSLSLSDRNVRLSGCSWNLIRV